MRPGRKKANATWASTSLLALTADVSVFGGSKQDCRSAHRASKVTSILEEGLPATDLSAQSDISEIGILVAVLKFAPKARDLTI